MLARSALRFAFAAVLLSAFASRGAEAAVGSRPDSSAGATLAASQEPAAPGPDVAPEAPERPSAKPARSAAEAKPAPAPPAKEGPPGRGPRGEQVNVRVDLRIRAQKGSMPPLEKTLSLVTVGDNSRTAIRTGSSIPFSNGPKPDSGMHYQSLALNADARALVEGRRVPVELTLSFTLASQAHEGEVEGRAAGTATLSVENAIRAVLDDGKALVVSDQVDAASDYRITVEAKATILR